MLKLLISLIPFIKELFFNKKEEMDFLEPEFNAKKWLAYSLFVSTVIVMLFVASRLFSITLSYIELEEKFKQHVELTKSFDDDIEKLKHQIEIDKKEIELLNIFCQRPPNLEGLPKVPPVKK